MRPLGGVPFAFGLISVLFLTTWWTRAHPDQAGDTFEWVSTNLHNLSVAPIRSFVLSALFLTDGRWLVNAALLAAVLVPLESRIGTRAAVAVFGSAHVLATLVTEGWVWFAIRAGASRRRRPSSRTSASATACTVRPERRATYCRPACGRSGWPRWSAIWGCRQCWSRV